jgi:single-strand DNA-binding protein
MNDTAMTIVGNLVDEPRLRVTKNGHSVANFRVASTSRRYDAEQSAWVDNATLFVTVTCWQGMV